MNYLPLPPRCPALPSSQILVGNKSDVAEGKRAVPYAVGKALADEYRIHFFETSAKENTNVEEVGGWVGSALWGSSSIPYCFTLAARHYPCPASQPASPARMHKVPLSISPLTPLPARSRTRPHTPMNITTGLLRHRAGCHLPVAGRSGPASRARRRRRQHSHEADVEHRHDERREEEEARWLLLAEADGDGGTDHCTATKKKKRKGGCCQWWRVREAGGMEHCTAAKKAQAAVRGGGAGRRGAGLLPRPAGGGGGIQKVAPGARGCCLGLTAAAAFRG